MYYVNSQCAFVPEAMNMICNLHGTSNLFTRSNLITLLCYVRQVVSDVQPKRSSGFLEGRKPPAGAQRSKVGGVRDLQSFRAFSWRSQHANDCYYITQFWYSYHLFVFMRALYSSIHAFPICLTSYIWVRTRVCTLLIHVSNASITFVFMHSYATTC